MGGVLEHPTEGRPLRVERMPFPEELTLKVNRSDEVFTLLMQLPELKLDADAEIEIVLAASYTNYVVANGVVLVPQYDRPGRPKRFAEADQRARSSLARLFPGRKVVGINAEPVNAGGGGLKTTAAPLPAPPRPMPMRPSCRLAVARPSRCCHQPSLCLLGLLLFLSLIHI